MSQVAAKVHDIGLRRLEMRIDTDLGSITLMRPGDDLGPLEEALDSSRYLILDTETDGLSRFRECRAVQICPEVGDSHVFLPKWGDDWLPLLTDFVGSIVGHNVTFDLITLQPYLDDMEMGSFRAGLGRGTVRDTQLGMQVHSPGLLSYALKKLKPEGDQYEKDLKAHFRKEGWKIEEAWGKVDQESEVMLSYSGYDVLLTRELYEDIPKEIWDSEQYLLETAVAAEFMSMSMGGVRVDVEKAKELNYGLETVKKLALLSLQDDWGIENPNSSQQIAAALEKAEVELVERTPKGAPSVKAEVLETIEHPIAELVLKLRRSSKVQSSYLRYFADSGGRVYPTYRTLPAVTGRSSIANPPLQQLPADDWTVRECILADEGDEVLVSIDYQQIELRVLAELSGDSKLLDHFAKGDDIHSQVAEGVFGAGFTKDDRSKAKAISFGIIYGAGAATLAKSAECSEIEAATLRDRWFQTYAEATAWMFRVKGEADRWGFTETKNGRKIPLEPEKAYKAVNYQIQGYAAYLFKVGLLALPQHLKSSVRLVVHDEVLLSLSRATWETDSLLAAEAMTLQRGGVVYPVDIDYHGVAWSDPQC